MSTFRSFVLVIAMSSALWGSSAQAREISVSGTTFRLDGQAFGFTGVSFFNALYNSAFNESPAARRKWLTTFQRTGIDVLRVWCQWDNKRGFVDSGPGSTMWEPDGRLRAVPLQRLQALATDADAAGMVIELALFSQESWHDGVRLEPAAMDRAVEGMARAMLRHRNVTFQIWNEFSERVLEAVQIIRKIDPKRLVTNSPGVGGVLGEAKQLEALDYLTPHTTRRGAGRHWEIAPREIAYLVTRYRKPVVDDEPARNGTRSFGGPSEETFPTDHILHIAAVWQAGGHVIYHHDMFQTGAGTPAVPPSGIPDPAFSPYHQVVFQFLARRARYSGGR